MGIEIERKFLVTGEFPKVEKQYLVQGYLNREPGRTMRVRIAESVAWITIKSLTNDYVRQEFEYEIPLPDAREILGLCVGTIVEKHRWIVQHSDHVWEVDEFLGTNAGLVVAEIELSSPDEEFALPGWVGEEVSSDARYHNSQLSIRPFQTWLE